MALTGEEKDRRAVLADRIARATNLAGLTRAELARATGISPSLISRYYWGQRTPKSHALSLISEATRVPVEVLLDGPGAPMKQVPGGGNVNCPHVYTVTVTAAGLAVSFSLRCNRRTAGHPELHRDPREGLEWRHPSGQHGG